MPRVDRRTFLKQSAALAGATFAIGVTARPVLGANERVNLGCVGIRGRGSGHINSYVGMGNTEVTWLVDIDAGVVKSRRSGVERKLLERELKPYENAKPKDVRKAEKKAADLVKRYRRLSKKQREALSEADRKNFEAAQKANKATKAARDAEAAKFRKLIEPRLPKCTKDIREALDDKNLDAISIATPNHWHALMTIWACQAGKDVYVEKPCSHNVFEGRKAVEAARKYKRIVQHGTQSRSSGHWAQLAAIARSGKLGKLLISHGIASKPRGGIGFKKPETPPEHIDFNLWLGPAPMQPYHRNIVPYNWHWFWDFGNGEIGNQGVHQMDIARWMIPGATLPDSVFSLGGRFAWGDQGQTPNTQLTVYTFGDALLVFENCNLTRKSRRVSNDAYFEAGKVVDGRKFFPKGSTKQAPLPKVDFKVGAGGPFGNFVNAIRSRKHTDLNADILEGHYSSALCHLGNISYRLGKDVPLAEGKKVLEGNDFATANWARLEKILVEENKVKLDELKIRVGPKLKFDAKTEKFIDAPDADKLLTRPYRKPFVVPDEV